jgi:ArsR family transcriptional regulator
MRIGGGVARLAEILSAAGEPTRLRILNLLLRGSICVCDLQAVLEVPQPTVSRHLAALRHAGLVQDSRNGPRVFYSLSAPDAPALRAFVKFLRAAARGETLLLADIAKLRARAPRKGAE